MGLLAIIRKFPVLQNIQNPLAHIFQHFGQTLMPLFAVRSQIDLQKMKVQSWVQQKIQSKELKVIFNLFVHYLVRKYWHEFSGYFLDVMVKFLPVVEFIWFVDCVEKHLWHDNRLGKLAVFAEKLFVMAVVC